MTFEDRSTQPADAEQELFEFHARKRTAYRIVLVIATAAVLIGWLLGAPADPFITWAYPVFGVLYAALLAGTFLPRIPAQQVEFGLFTVIGLHVLCRLVWQYFAFSSVDASLLVLVGGHYWALGILVVACAVLLGRQRGMWAGSLLLGLSAVIAVAGLWDDYLAGAIPARSLGYLIRVHLFILLLLVMTSLSTAAWENYWQALHSARRFEHWATTDNLTGLANRRAVERFTQELDFQAQTVSVVLLDLDHFKSVNDSLGHMRGDEVLQEVGARLKSVVADGNLLARWGGEEFLIVAPGTSLSDAVEIAAACNRVISEQPVAGLMITATCGVAESSPVSTFNDLIRKADDRMYSGKKAGRNLIIVDDCDVASPSSA